jgi:hypothetical protein
MCIFVKRDIVCALDGREVKEDQSTFEFMSTTAAKEVVSHAIGR